MSGHDEGDWTAGNPKVFLPEEDELWEIGDETENGPRLL